MLLLASTERAGAETGIAWDVASTNSSSYIRKVLSSDNGTIPCEKSYDLNVDFPDLFESYDL